MRDLINIVENAQATPAERLATEVGRGDRYVSLDLRVLDPTTVSIAQIWSEFERGKGHGTRKMQEIIDAADRLGVTLRLIATPLRYDIDSDDGFYDDDPRGYDLLADLNDQGLDEHQLRAWYERFGFVFDPDHESDAVREPRHK